MVAQGAKGAKRLSIFEDAFLGFRMVGTSLKCPSGQSFRGAYYQDVPFGLE